MKILPRNCCFSDLKEQPAQTDLTQNPSTLVRSFARNVALFTVKVWMGFSVFRIFPAFGFTDLPMDLKTIF